MQDSSERPALATHVAQFIKDHHVLSLAVRSEDDSPYAVNLFYCLAADGTILIFTKPDSVHGRSMLEFPRVAGTISGSETSWNKIRGVQFKANARPLLAEKADISWKVYRKRFPFLKFQPPALVKAITSAHMWALEPSWIRFIDNTKAFKHKEEWHFS
jgi:uncharacterized protein YhbP (UPF0306 family)